LKGVCSYGGQSEAVTSGQVEAEDGIQYSLPLTGDSIHYQFTFKAGQPLEWMLVNRRLVVSLMGLMEC
jgi:hypothetical protein